MIKYFQYVSKKELRWEIRSTQQSGNEFKPKKA